MMDFQFWNLNVTLYFYHYFYTLSILNWSNKIVNSENEADVENLQSQTVDTEEEKKKKIISMDGL